MEQGKCGEAKRLLLNGFKAIKDNPYARDEQVAEAIKRLVDLYESWNPAEPGKGYDTKATEWRAKLPKIEKSEQPEP